MVDVKDMVVIGGSGVIGEWTMKLFNITDNYSNNKKTLTLEEVAKKKIIFFCLPTPAKGIHDISVIRDYIKKLEKLKSNALYVIRSTTTPGQLKSLSEEWKIDKIVHYPEFLTMSTAEYDTFNPDIVVLGGESKYTDQLVKMIENILEYAPRYFQTDLTTSELIKCSINAFYALKVIYATEIYQYAQSIGASYDTVKNAMYERNWIGHNHLDVPFNGKFGVHGKCLPKELEAMANATKSQLLITAKEINDKLTS